MSTFGRGQNTRSTHPEPPPPWQPLANNTNGAGMQLAESVISSSVLSAFVNSFVDEFVASLTTANFGGSDGILNNAAPINPTDGTPLPRRSLFNDGEEEMMQFVMGAVNKLAPPGVDIASFLSLLTHRAHNSKNNSNKHLFF
jgi:hypothetical protein